MISANSIWTQVNIDFEFMRITLFCELLIEIGNLGVI